MTALDGYHCKLSTPVLGEIPLFRVSVTPGFVATEIMSAGNAYLDRELTYQEVLGLLLVRQRELSVWEPCRT